jgi:putative transposase
MRHPRILGLSGGEVGVCFYHVLSRVIERRFIFEDRERDLFKKLMRQQELFSGVRVLTWTCMSNHFHMLVAVDDRSADEQQQVLDQLMQDDEAFFVRLGHIYHQDALKDLRKYLKLIRESSASDEAKIKEIAKWKQPYLNRMFDLSCFVGEIKQRLSQWYNREHLRIGPLWEDRFKSVLVQGESGVLATVAAYIDLNAVRAGIVKDPRDWRWCGYSEAVAAQSRSRNGMYEVLGLGMNSGQANVVLRDGEAWRNVHQRYRELLMHEAMQRRDEDGRVVRKGISPEEFAEEEARGFELPSPLLLHQRIRYFVDGLVLGSEAFVESVFKKNRRKMGVKRKIGARVPKLPAGADLSGLRTLCDLRCGSKNGEG